MADWQSRPLEECIEQVVYTKKVQRKDFLAEGAYPVVSQEDAFVNGFWDNEADLFRVQRPVVVFGDHTRALKYIDFDFVLGADGVKVLKPKPFLYPRFFYFQLHTAKLDSLGYARHYRLLREHHVAYPAYAEQQRIVATLDLAFEGIATAKASAEKILQNVRELFQSHLEQVFLRHVDSSPSRPLEALTESDSPITYGVVKPGDEGDVAFVRGGDIAQGRVLTEQLRTINATVSRQYRRTLLRGGELLISLVGQPGQVAVAPEELKGANIARQVGLIRLNEQVDAEYVRYFLQSPVGQSALGAKQSGSVQQVINLGGLREVMVPVPALAVQREAVQTLYAFSASVERLTGLVQSKLSALGELKKSLLYQAFSGAFTNESVDKEVAEVA